MRYNSSYRLKISGCISAIKTLGIRIDDLLEPYKQSVSEDGFSSNKAKMFEEILNCDLTLETYKYLTLKCDLARFKDRRQPFEYATDLVLGWLIEDAICLYISRAGVQASLYGADSGRDFLAPHSITTQPDLRIHANEQSRLVEIFSDWKDTWKKYDHMDLREGKFGRLKAEGALLLGIAPLSQQGFLLDFNEGDNGFKPSYIEAYRKYGFTRTNLREIFVPIPVAIEHAVACVV